MRIAVINETSAAERNADILAALEGRGHTVLNAGMTEKGAVPELTYIQTGLIAAILLNLERVDFVVGGCGTGLGFLNSVMQYPGVFCGHIMSPLDAWLFTKINAGNCVSLALHEGYGWASDVNLRFIFDHLLSDEAGGGYPTDRGPSQRESRQTLVDLSLLTHREMVKIIPELPEDIVRPALSYPGISELIDADSLEDEHYREVFARWYRECG